MEGGTFSNCEADEGGIAYLVSSTLSISRMSFSNSSAKRGGVFWVDFGENSTSSVSWRESDITDNSASDEDENGIDWGKGGAIFVTGTTTSKTPLVQTDSRFENTAAFGNDVFVEEEVLGEIGPDPLSKCGGESSGF
ncbi:hypothetical protein BLNAU_19062 [Blattamonas nauphoetae]|uniref:Uncharacterized protein n=1 Tax=Blattamonas nauphoetae TaxID=2049346 RepID=A0ABQ9X5S4_9EUKA|nr:hypothetical protein BLNAU_19062 [Blattamonas nauphoetae]